MYQIRFTKSALKESKKLPEYVWVKIKPNIFSLESDPFPIYSKRLKDIKVLYRIRVGDYRVIYQVENKKLIILIIKIAPRKEVYSNL